MTDELMDELRLSRALRLDATERVSIDARPLAEAAATAEQAQLVRGILGVLALALAVPAAAVARIAVTVIGDPSHAADPIALLSIAALPMLDWLGVLAQPATALAAVAALAIYSLGEGAGRERAHVLTSRT